MAAVIYRVEHGYVTVAGADIPVSKFQLSLVQNGIPKLKVEVDPVHSGQGSPGDGDPSDARSAEFSQLYSRYSSLFALIDERAGAKASFSFSMIGTDGDEQVLDLKDWILTDVGIGSFGFGSQLNVLLTIEHPAVKLNDGGMYLIGEAADTGDDDPPAGANVFESVVANLTQRAASGVVTGQPDATEKVMGRTRDLIEALPAVMAWSDGAPGWPAMGLFDAYKAYAVYNAIASVRHMTPWEFVSRELVNHWFLTIRPTYWKDKLEIGPSNPWAPASLTISDGDIATASVPSSGDRLSGIINANLLPALMGTSAALWTEGSIGQFNVAQAYIEEIAGPVIPVNTPGYVASVVEEYLSNNSSALDLYQKEFEATTSDATLTAFATEMAGPMADMMEKVCKQTFCNYYRQSVSTTLKLRLMLNAGGGAHLTPGFTCGVSSSAGPVMKFLVTSVDHVVDCTAASAYTVVGGAHVSPAGQPNLGGGSISAGVAENNYVYV